MKVILAGATGAIGRPLLAALTAAGHEVFALIRNPAHGNLVTGAGATPVIADVMEQESLLTSVEGLSADAVLHQATALRNAGRTLGPDDPTNALRDTGTRHLLSVARAVGARRFVTQSLITGYGYRDHGERILTEADAFSDMFAAYLRKHVPLRPLGRGGANCFIHVNDAAAATVAALERGRAGEAYNIVDDSPATWREFIDAVAEAHGTPRPISLPGWAIRMMVPYLGALLIDTRLRASHAKAAEQLGWSPAIANIRTGLGLEAGPPH